MATRVIDEFGVRANPADANYPDGSLKNESAPLANDGSPLEERVGNDYEGLKQSLLARASIPPNGQPDSVTNPQQLNAIEFIAKEEAHAGDLEQVFSFSDVAAMKAVGNITPADIDTSDLSASTRSYYGGWDNTLNPFGGAKYILTTRQRVRDTKVEPAWEPDGYGDHYLFGGTDYVAVLNYEKSVNVFQFGVRPDDRTTTVNAQAAYDYGATIIDWPENIYEVDAIAIDNLHGIVVPSNRLTRIAPGSVMKTYAPNANEYTFFSALTGTENVFWYQYGVTYQGDRDTHTGVTGEQGFGIRLGGVDNYAIRGGTFKDFWGDGLFIGKFGAPGQPRSTNGYIHGVLCDNNRRQGMSLVSVQGLTVEDSRFTNTNGTSPEAGVDSEPNASDLPNYDVTFRRCSFSGDGGGFIAPFADGTSDFHFHECYFYGKQGASPGGSALSWNSNGANGLSTFNNCHFFGVVPILESAIVNGGSLTIDDTYLQSVYGLAITNDTPVSLVDFDIIAKGEKRCLNEGGGLADERRKKLVRVRFIKEGDQGASFVVVHSAGKSTYTDCTLAHRGTAPVSPFFLSGTIDGIELVIESITGETEFTIGGLAGRYSTAYPIRGTGTPEGVITAPVGTEYMDVGAIPGSIRYLKSSGTGNTGWVLL